MKKIGFLMFTLLVTNISSYSRFDFIQEFREISTSIEESEVSYDSDNLNLRAVNLTLNSCESFPYFGQEGSSSKKLVTSIEKGLRKLGQCFENKNVPSYVHGKMNKLVSILSDQEVEKYITCNFEMANSYIAIATTDENSDSIVRYPQIKKHPGMIINTNRVSGNFPLGMTEQQRENTFNFYGGRIPFDIIIPGEINPAYHYISNPMSLVIHEMLHWTDTVHFEEKYPDIVYLTQACCFDQIGLDEEIKSAACESLFNHDLYQENEDTRLRQIEESGVRNLVKNINKDLHRVSNEHRYLQK